MNSLPHNSVNFCHKGKQWGLCATLGAHFVLAAVVFTGLPTFNTMVLPAPAVMHKQSVVSLRVLPASQKPLAAPPTPEAAPVLSAPALEPTPVPAVQRRSGKQPSPAKPIKAKAPQSPTKTAARSTPAANTPTTSKAQSVLQNKGQNEQHSEAHARQTILSYFMHLLERNKHYPRAARKLGLEGLINVELRIDAQGNIAMLNIGATTAHPVLRKAMDESLHKVRSQWQARQAIQGGQAGEALSLTVPVRFSLQDGG